MTLIEVVLGLGLLGTLLAGCLLAQADLQHQSRRARDVIEAADAADALLRQWWDDPRGVPRGQGGPVPHRPTWRWRTSVVRRTTVGMLRTETLRLEILHDEHPEPLTAVEVLLPAATVPETNE